MYLCNPETKTTYSMTMETTDLKDMNIDTEDLNSFLKHFCASILVYYQDILVDKELSVCKYLINGLSVTETSERLGMKKERVRLLFRKAILKISHAHHQRQDEIAKLKEEIGELKHRNLILERECLSEQSVEYVNSVMSNEKTLCRNAKRLLNTPIDLLPLPQKCKKILASLKVSQFSEIPLLSETMLLETNNCGKKTIHDLQAYLHRFSLDLGLTYDEVVIQMAQLNDDDISPENFHPTKAR